MGVGRNYRHGSQTQTRIPRGNYRKHIFKTEGANTAFEACLFEACAKCNWVLHAHLLESNHYHLALETPVGTRCGHPCSRYCGIRGHA